MRISRGDVFWIRDREGRRRPGLILTRDSAIPLLNRVVVAPATRTIRGIPTEVRADRADGMPADCAFSIDNIRVVPKSALTRRITTLDAARLDEACEAVAYALGC